jgi:uncharacterized protein (DUF362 family)
MAKGASIKFKTFNESVLKLLELINLQTELKKHDSIILKINLFKDESIKSTNTEFAESVLRFCLAYKSPTAQVFIAEGAEGIDTQELFESKGYKVLAEKYGIGLIDLNNSETEEIAKKNFQSFDVIHYPSILKNSFVISIPSLSQTPETLITGIFSSFLGAFPSKYYRGFFAKDKSKMRKHPIKYAIHDIIQCKMPDFAVVDASDKGIILAGIPLEIEKQSAKLEGFEWNHLPYLKMLNETLEQDEDNSETF